MPGSRARSDQRQPLSLWDSAPVWQVTGLGAAASWVVWRGVSPCTGCYMECAPDAYVEWREFRAKTRNGGRILPTYLRPCRIMFRVSSAAGIILHNWSAAVEISHNVMSLWTW